MSKKQIMKNEDLVSLIDNYPGGMVVINLEGKILAANVTLGRIFNLSREKLIGISGYPYVEKAVGEQRRNIMESIVRDKKTVEIVDYERGHWWKTIFVPKINSSNNVVGFFVYFNDITTEMKKEERKLINQEEYYISLIENSTDLITVVDKTGNILYESPPLEKMLGYKISERLGKKTFENIHPDDITRVKQYFKESISQPGLTNKLTYRIKDKNGIYHYFESVGNNQIHNPLINGLIINSRDITERQNDRERISKQKLFLDNLVNSASEIIFTVDRDHKVSLWNAAAERNTGISKTKVVGKKLRSINLFENISEFHEYLNHVFAGKDGFLNQLVVKSNVGGKRLWSASPSTVKSNDVISDVVLICQDMTFKDEIHGRLIPGRGYLVSEVSADSLFDVFKGLLHSGWNGLCITRNRSDVSPDYFNDLQPTMLMFSSYDSGKGVVSSLDELFDAIEVFVKETKNAAMCLNRVDYLISRFGFDRVLNFLYRVNDLMKIKQGLFLLRVNKTLFSSEQISFLQEEFSILPSQQMQDVSLEDMMYNLLSFIFKENEKNSLVSQKNICNHFGIVKVTAQKRIEDLLEKGLIISRKRGRSKFLHVTDKGKELLHRRKTI
jgi:PAS domain S-box-containing protein